MMKLSFNIGKINKPKRKCGHRSIGYENVKFNKKELEKGIEIELEHTCDRKMAETIAKDHLSEFDKYYTYLERMEKLLESNKKIKSLPDKRKTKI